jgi:hypothetical protein
MSIRTIESIRRCVAVEIIDLEHALERIAHALVRLRAGFAELSDIVPPSLPPRPELDGQVG